MDIVAAVVFGLALAHTFATKFFERLASRIPRHAGLFHLLGEVEVVFGFWAFVLIGLMAAVSGAKRRSPTRSRGSSQSRCSCS